VTVDALARNEARLPSTNERKLAAIFFSDMVDFSAQMGEDEAGTFELLQRHNAVLDREVAAHSGRVVKTIGDAYMVEFSSSVSAVACGLEVQRAFEQMNAASEEEPAPYRVRIGIHVGDVVAHQGDLFGDAVNIAARLERLAPVGGLCVSAAVYQQVRKKVHATGEDGGFERLKNIVDPVRVLYLYPSSEHLDQVLNDESAVARLAAKKRAPISWLAATGVLLFAIAVTAALDHDPGISPTPQPLHKAGAEERPPDRREAQATLEAAEDAAGSKEDGEVTTIPTTVDETPKTTGTDKEAAAAKATEQTDVEEARKTLRDARKSRRLEARQRIQSTAENVATSGTSTNTPAPAEQGILKVSGDAYIVRFKGPDGVLYTAGSAPVGQYAVWTAWDEDDEVAPTGISLKLAAGEIKTLRCSSGLQICQAP